MRKKKFVRLFPVFLCFVIISAPSFAQKGKWEIGFHAGAWNINMLRGAVEESMGEGFEGGFKNSILETIQEDHPNLIETSYSQTDFSFEWEWHIATR